VLEVPFDLVDSVLEKLTLEMRRPISQQPIAMSKGGWLEDAEVAARNFPDYLTINVEAKIGKNWAAFNDNPAKGRMNLDGMKKTSLKDVPDTLAADTMIPMDLYDDELSESEIQEILSRMDLGVSEEEGAIA
jgi:hypothetical protein